MDSQSAGWFFKRAQNTSPHKTHLQTAQNDLTNLPRMSKLYGIGSNFIDFYSFLTIRFWLVFFKETVFFCTIMLLFCKAILLWQHWWFWFFSKSRWLVSKGLSDKMIVIEINFKIIFKAISHWKQFCFLRNSHFVFKAITLWQRFYFCYGNNSQAEHMVF